MGDIIVTVAVVLAATAFIITFAGLIIDVVASVRMCSPVERVVAVWLIPQRGPLVRFCGLAAIREL